MRSPIDWLSEFYGPKRNTYMRLSERERARAGVMMMWIFILVAVSFVILRWLR